MLYTVERDFGFCVVDSVLQKSIYSIYFPSKLSLFDIVIRKSHIFILFLLSMASCVSSSSFHSDGNGIIFVDFEDP